MNKPKNQLIFSALVFAVVLALSFYLFLHKNDASQFQDGAFSTVAQQSASGIILFYGYGCPHCAVVEKYLEQNQVGDKVQFNRKEVYLHPNNAKELKAKAKGCGIPEAGIGVPFLWDGERCLIGDQPIIEYFRQRAEAK
ncbi:MAG: DsbA family protein [Burkholderiaceae bacterium]|nr:DsbA family protein [Burkholderiaceae bacterium]